MEMKKLVIALLSVVLSLISAVFGGCDKDDSTKEKNTETQIVQTEETKDGNEKTEKKENSNGDDKEKEGAVSDKNPSNGEKWSPVIPLE